MCTLTKTLEFFEQYYQVLPVEPWVDECNNSPTYRYINFNRLLSCVLSKHNYSKPVHYLKLKEGGWYFDTDLIELYNHLLVLGDGTVLRIDFYTVDDVNAQVQYTIEEVTPQKITEWANKHLNFEPGKAYDNWRKNFIKNRKVVRSKQLIEVDTVHVNLDIPSALFDNPQKLKSWIIEHCNT